MVKNHHLKWDLKFVDDYCFETPQVDDFVLSPKDKMFDGDDDKLSG